MMNIATTSSIICVPVRGLQNLYTATPLMPATDRRPRNRAKVNNSFRHAVDAAARPVDVDQDLADRVIGLRLTQGRGKLLRVDSARSRDIIVHVAALRDHAVQRQYRIPPRETAVAACRRASRTALSAAMLASTPSPAGISCDQRAKTAATAFSRSGIKAQVVARNSAISKRWCIVSSPGF